MSHICIISKLNLQKKIRPYFPYISKESYEEKCVRMNIYKFAIKFYFFLLNNNEKLPKVLADIHKIDKEDFVIVNEKFTGVIQYAHQRSV